MQSTRLLIGAQRCSSVSRIQNVLRRTFIVTTSSRERNLKSSLVDSNVLVADHGRFWSLSRNNRFTSFGEYQSYRFASSGSLPSFKKISLPALSPTMETGTLRSWSKKEGDKISEGDILAEIETDKATLGFEAGDEGFLAKILIPAGSKDVPVGKPCAIIVERAEDIAAFANYTDDGASSTVKVEKKEQETTSKVDQTPIVKSESKPASTGSSTGGDRAMASPLAKKLAQEKGIDLKSVAGSGPQGRIVAEDVEKFIREGGAKVKATNETQKTQTKTAAPKVPKKDATRTVSFDEQQISAWKIENARRATESKSSIPHYYLTIEVELDEILKLRQKLNEMVAPKGKDGKEKGRGLTVNDFIVKAAALACKKRPETNSIWMEKVIRQYETVDINVAINTDAGVMMTPIICNADQKGLSALSTEIGQLSEKANNGQLTDQELEGGTFTITNLGMYGITNFSAVIQPQQSAVLAIGGVDTKIVPAPDSPKGYRLKTVLNVTLACDHRVIDGAVGAQWLQEFKQFLEQPGSMIL